MKMRERKTHSSLSVGREGRKRGTRRILKTKNKFLLFVVIAK